MKNGSNADVKSVYCELLQLLHDKPIQQVHQEYGQISDVIKGYRSGKEDDDNGDGEWMLRTVPDVTSSTKSDISQKTNDTSHNNPLQHETDTDNVGSIPQHQEQIRRIHAGNDDVTVKSSKNLNHIDSSFIHWIPVRPDSSLSSSLSPSQAWEFYLEYMPSLQYMQITIRPPTQNDINKEILNIDHVRVSLDVPKYHHMKQDHDAGPMDILFMFEYIDSNVNTTSKKNNQTNGLFTKLHLQLPSSLLIDNKNTTPLLFPQYTTSLVEDNTAIAIRLQCIYQGNNDTFDHSIRDLPRYLEPLDDYSNDKSTSQSALHREPRNLCLGCRNCHTPFIPISFPSLSLYHDKTTRATTSLEYGNINCGLDILLDSTALPVHHIVPLPTGHLNDLHDYLICYNDGPTNVNFNPNNIDDNDQRYDIPPTGVMYENDIIYAAAEANVNTWNLSTLSIPGYGTTSHMNVKNDKQTIPLDIVHNSQIWKCHTLPPITNGNDSTENAPLTVTCSLCASTIGYKVVSATTGIMDHSTSTSDPIGISVGYHLLKHQMILLQNKNSSIPIPIQTQSAISDTEQQSTEMIIPFEYKRILSHSISQFIIYEMVRIAESKGIFTFVIGKHFTDVLHNNEGQNDGSDQVNMASPTSKTAAIKLQMLNWKTIAASWNDSCVPMATSKGSTDLVTPATDDVRVPVWQRRAKVYYETILMDKGIVEESTVTPTEQSLPSDTPRSFRNQFMAQHNAWCCQDDTTSLRSNAGLFLKGVIPTDTAKVTFNDENIEEIIDPTIIRLYLSMDEFDMLFMQLQESSKFYSKEIAQAIQLSVTTVNNLCSYNNQSTIGLACVAL